MTVLFHWRKAGWIDDIGDPDFSAYVPVGERSIGTAGFSYHTKPGSPAWAVLAATLGGPWIAEDAHAAGWYRREADGASGPADELAVASESVVELWRLRFPDGFALEPGCDPNPQFQPLNEDYGASLRARITAAPADEDVSIRVPQYRHAPGNHMRPFVAAAARCGHADIHIGPGLVLVRSLVGEALIGLSGMMREN